MKWFIAMAGLLLAASTGAEEVPAPKFEGYTKFLYYHVHYDVNADGTHTETQEWATKVLAEQGIEDANTAGFRYSDSLQSAEVLKAYTLKADGRRIEVPPDNYQEQSNTGRGKGSPMFSDLRRMTVAFPEVEVGDTVVFAYRLVQKEALFPGHFSTTHAFSPFRIIEEIRVSLSASAELPLKVLARDVAGGELEPSEGRRHWRWTHRITELAQPERGAVAAMDYGPLVMASTFGDYGALAAAYESRARPKAAVTDRIRTLAAELTAGIEGRREQAAALYDWVSRNIDYAGNCVGIGSVVPHDTDTILNNRMGDCKDHTALLQALLAAKGIESTPALVNSGSVFSLPEVPVVSVFNHVINYLPEFDLYVDATSEYVPFGELPSDESGKPVIHTARYDGIRQTPATDYRHNRSRSKTVLRIAADGSAEGETTVQVSGVFASSLRGWFHYLRPDMEEDVVRKGLSSSGYTGIGSMEWDDPLAGGSEYRYSTRFRIEDAANLPGPGAVYLRSVMGSSAPIASFLGSANERPRTTRFQCMGGISVEEYELHFPEGTRFLALPGDMQLDNPLGSYRARYKAEGSRIKVVRELEDRTPGNVCSPQVQADFKPFAAAVLKDLRTQLIYQ